ncbi:MAG: high frequency lysogenization protein HflD [Cellvibrionaceae bacterium]
MKKWNERTIALAGVLQATAIVDQLSKSGQLRKEEFTTCINALLEQKPSSTLSTYGDISQLELGLQLILDSFDGMPRESAQNPLRYALGVFHLQAKLINKPDLLDIIGSRLIQANQQAAHFEPTHDNVINNLAGLYSDTISKFRFRIQVTGDVTYLQQERTASQIRALLFSAIRSAMLFSQVGGRRWHLLVYRKKILQCAHDLLREAKSTRKNIH